MPHTEKLCSNTKIDGISLARAANYFAVDGHAPHVATLHRWADRGVCVAGERVFLRTGFAGRKRYTTEQWIAEFQAAMDAAATRKRDGERDQHERLSARQERELAEAEAELASEGI